MDANIQRALNDKLYDKRKIIPTTTTTAFKLPTYLTLPSHRTSLGAFTSIQAAIAGQLG
jgi:hypothetical protein